MTAEIQLYSSVATCPYCDCQTWFIHLNGLYDRYDKVTAYECSNCRYKIDINIEVIKERHDN